MCDERIDEIDIEIIDGVSMAYMHRLLERLSDVLECNYGGEEAIQYCVDGHLLFYDIKKRDGGLIFKTLVESGILPKSVTINGRYVPFGSFAPYSLWWSVVCAYNMEEKK